MGEDIKSKSFSKGLLPTVVVDRKTGRVLMLAFSSPETVELTLRKKLAHFFSRERKKVWMKGEESGNIMHVSEVFTDCDADSFIFVVEPEGPACHTKKRSCFFRKVKGIEFGEKGQKEENEEEGKVEKERKEDERGEGGISYSIQAGDGVYLYVDENEEEFMPGGGVLTELENIIRERKRRWIEEIKNGSEEEKNEKEAEKKEKVKEKRKKGRGVSYTISLFQGGLPKIIGKIMEEAGELCESALIREKIQSISKENPTEKGIGIKNSVVWEATDLIYHVLVLLSYFDIPFEDVLEELMRRMKEKGK